MRLKEAIVIGGGMAGLTHARVLADYAEQVTILERDELPESFEPRRGVPQGQHIHYLLVRGLRVLDELFPGLHDELEQNSGAPKVQIGLHTQYTLFGRTQARIDAGIHTYNIARPHLEQIVRQLLLKQHTNIRIVERTDVDDLKFDGQRVTGVTVRERGTGEESVYSADLVVDASGRRSKVYNWLDEAGFPVPETTRIDADIGYATRWFKKPADANNDWRILYSLPSPPHQIRSGAILEHSDGRWLMSIGGTNGDFPPTDEAGFNAFVQGLPEKALYEAIQSAEPLSDIVGYRNMPNEWHHFEKLARVPEGFIATGDAVCIVNPIYGQGMTKAALNAQVMGKLLASGSLDSARFYKQVAPINQEFWDTAAISDLNYPGTRSNVTESMMGRIKRDYLKAVLYGVPRDEVVGTMFHRVLNMVDPSTKLLMPGMVWRVLRAQQK